MSANSFNRRDFLNAAALRKPVHAEPGATVPAQESQAGPGVSPLTLVSAGSPGFSALLESKFPGASRRLNMAKIMPVAAILYNPQDKAIKAVAVRWTVQTPEGPHSEVIFHYMPAWRSRNGSNRKSKGIARRNLAASGRAVLLTPTSILTSGAFSRGYSPNLARSLAKTTRGQFYTELAGKVAPSSVTHTVEGIYYADESVTGPQGPSLHRHVRLLQNAEHDQALSVFHAVKTTTLPTKLPKKLSSRRFRYLGSKATRIKRDYQSLRKQHATTFAKVFKKHGQQQLLSYLTVLKHYPKINVAPESKG